MIDNLDFDNIGSNNMSKETEDNLKNLDKSNNSVQAEQDMEQLKEGLSTESNTLETLKQQLEALKQKSDQNYDLALRAKAELDNVRKRSQQDVTNAHKYALERFIPELFPLLDGLDQGLNSMSEGASLEQMHEGISLSVKMFSDVLSKFGVEVFDPLNQPFDPSKHEAISMQVTSEFAAGIVMAVVQKGYILNNRVLRPARVVVAQSE